jgi:hypothetical protein
LKQWIDHSARIKRFKGKALIEENGYSLVKINNAAYTPFKLAFGACQESNNFTNFFDIEYYIRTNFACSNFPDIALN